MPMQPLLQTFNIRSFRGLKNVSLENLGRINLIVGENNSGKTSVLEALMTFSAPGMPRNWLKVLNARDVGISDDNVGEAVSWLFPVIGRDRSTEREEILLEGTCNGSNKSIRLKYLQETEVAERIPARSGSYSDLPEEEAPTRKVARVFAEWFSQSDGAKSGDLVFGSAGRSMLSRMTPTISESIKHIRTFPMEFVKPHSHRLGRMAAGAITNAVWSQKKDLLVGVLQIFDADITDVNLVAHPVAPTLVIDHRKLGTMPIHAFGDGLRKAVIVTGYALRANGGVLLLDEAETALHAHAQGAFFAGLWKLCEELNVQVFLTTHSLDAVDSVLRASGTQTNSIVGFHINNVDGVRSVKRFAGEMMERLRFERGLDIR